MPDGVSDPPKPFLEPRIGERVAPRQAANKRRAVNVSVDEALLVDARALKINISRTLEEALYAKVHAEKVRRFQEENREAFESYNRFIAENGLWINEYRES